MSKSNKHKLYSSKLLNKFYYFLFNYLWSSKFQDQFNNIIIILPHVYVIKKSLLSIETWGKSLEPESVWNLIILKVRGYW